MLTDEKSFSENFNVLYMTLKDKSSSLKEILVAIYKKRSLFVRSLCKENYNMDKLYCSMKDDDLSKILKRSPIRNGSFLDLLRCMQAHREKCKRHIIMERLRAPQVQNYLMRQ
jgi:hypothetical protein